MEHLYASDLDATHTTVEVDAALHRHIDALRLRNSDSVLVFNGRGLVVRCRVERSGTHTSLVVEDATHVQPPVRLLLAIGGLDHRDRFEFAVEKAVELGATQIIPIHSERVQRTRSTPERLNSKAIAAVTQSGNAWLPSIEEPTTLTALLGQLDSEIRILVGDPAGGTLNPQVAVGPVCCVVGPEGGFTPSELELLLADERTTPIAIGRLRLRAETAAIAMLSVCAALRT